MARCLLRALVSVLAPVAGCAFDSMGGSGGLPPVGDGTATETSASAPGDDAPGTTAADPSLPLDPDGTSTSSEPTSDITTTDAPTPCIARPPWWDDHWGRRRPLDLDTSGLVEDLADVPILVRLDPGRIDYAATEPNGADLRFVGSDQRTTLAYEIEHWDPTGTSYLWLRVPVLTAGTTPRLWMYYEHAGAPAGVDPGKTWDAAFVSVHHGPSGVDSTAAGHHATSTNPPMSGLGIAGRTGIYDGTDDFLQLPDEAAYDFTTALTVEAWIRVAAFDIGWQAIVTKGDDAYRLHRDGSSAAVGFGTDTALSDNDNLPGTQPVDDGQWHYVVIVYRNQEKLIFVDGECDAMTPYAGPIATTNHPVLIGENAQQQNRFFDGAIDEVRLSSVGRSDAWIALQNRSIRDEGVVIYGGEETCL